MSKYFSALLLSVLTLVACQKASPGTGVSDSSASSVSASSEVQTSSVVSTSSGALEQTTWEFIHLWASATLWSAPVAGTNDFAINIDATHQIPAKALQAQTVTAQMNSDEFNDVFMDIDSRDALSTMAREHGWTIMSSLDADGVTGTAWGYKMSTPEGMRFLIVSAVGTDCSDTSGQPTTCTKYEGKVQLTAALPASADL